MDNFTKKLILSVKERPILYVKDHIDNKNSIKKAVAWEEVSNEIGGRDGETAKEKWKNLRDTYKKYKKTQLPNPNTPAVQKLKNWVWAPHMEFVDKLISIGSDRCSKSHPNSYIQPTGSDRRIDANTSLDSVDNEQHNILELNHGLSAPRSAGTTPQDNKVNTSNKRRIMEPPDETADYLKTPKREQHSDELDKIDYLFLHYAETFKTFTPRRQAVVKLELAKMFAEAELQNMDEIEQRGCETSIKIENVMQYYPDIDISSNSD